MGHCNLEKDVECFVGLQRGRGLAEVQPVSGMLGSGQFSEEIEFILWMSSDY